MSFSLKKYLIPMIIVASGITIWEFSSPPFPSVQIGDTRISVEIVQSKDELAKGLSGRPSLNADSGMLFIMPKKDNYTFWMKGMLFSIDIIWIADHKIVGIDRNLPLDGGQKLYQSPDRVDEILEVNAGLAEKHNFHIGDEVTVLK